MFSLFQKNLHINEHNILDKLKRISCFGLGTELDMSKNNMLKVLSEVEERTKNQTSAKIEYWLGVAWRNYTGWHEHGDERKQFFEKAISHYQRAFEISKTGLSILLPENDRHYNDNLDQLTIAGDLGFMLVEEALVRDLDRAEPILNYVYENTSGYEPCLCPYAELYYKRGDYRKCVEIALESHRRAVTSKEWGTSPPPAPLDIASRAYRALAKQAKNDNNTEDAIKYFGKIKELGLATENDKKLLLNLQTLQKQRK